MSNHSGSYMLNSIVKTIVDLGLLENASDAQKEALTKKLWSLCWENDCNWGEIVGKDLSGWSDWAGIIARSQHPVLFTR